MLRNLPNKVTQAQVKEIVDKSSFGEYDFSYLRIGKFFCKFSYSEVTADIPQTSPTTASSWFFLLSLQPYSHS